MLVGGEKDNPTLVLFLIFNKLKIFSCLNEIKKQFLYSDVSFNSFFRWSIERIGLMPMPIDISVAYEDGSVGAFYIPLQMMRADKPNPIPNQEWTVLPDWAWANPTYEFDILNGKKVKTVTIDPSGLMADVNLENNRYKVE